VSGLEERVAQLEIQAGLLAQAIVRIIGPVPQREPERPRLRVIDGDRQ
jgi:hypothetical protein